MRTISTNRDNGFTLLELLFTLAIGGIILAMAVPSFKTFAMNNRLTTQNHALVASLTLARSEAIKRGQRVVVCKSSDGASCSTANTINWENGWIVFVDSDNDSTIDSGETLRVSETLEGGNTLRSDSNYSNSVTYLASGLSTQAGTLVLCDDRNSDGDTADSADFSSGLAVIVNTTGRARTTTASGSGFTNCVTAS
ncbi:GspH/FimT family pseudopilin [Candidatus Reidiella endopervernicosa]|uniref:Type II secretion system protein H n=1 Tax=Candidatus Reidiella endopervernicosa TaxID=2738883 RepID=A0A6N0HZV8_9GAMM|nr:GspH/FimT family protein [Candidatus Reidiella endopervernicosa]QKQ27716.1 type II transport protein [Candidatus Reidiella endopervernicosa]